MWLLFTLIHVASAIRPKITFTKTPWSLPCKISGACATCKAGKLGEKQLAIFGGYIEEEGEGGNLTRTASNKLIELDLNNGDVVEREVNVEGRLCAAAGKIDETMFIFGGWAPPREGKMSDDHYDHVFDLDAKLYPKIPVGSSSRHVVVALPNNEMLLHNHRTSSPLYTFDGTKWTLHEATNNPMPARGLHVAAALPDGNIVFFGGSSDEMKNDVWVLCTSSTPWKWMEVKVAGGKPQPRAGSICFPVGCDGMCVFGGAEATENGLNALNDLWYLELKVDGDSFDGEWTMIQENGSEIMPPPRNAATLTKIAEGKFVLAGGWRPFIETWQDVWIIDVA